MWASSHRHGTACPEVLFCVVTRNAPRETHPLVASIDYRCMCANGWWVDRKAGGGSFKNSRGLHDDVSTARSTTLEQSRKKKMMELVSGWTPSDDCLIVAILPTPKKVTLGLTLSNGSLHRKFYSSSTTVVVQSRYNSSCTAAEPTHDFEPPSF